MIKAVIFDLDDTLYSWKSAHEIAFAKVCEYAGEKLNIPPQAFQESYNAEFDFVKQRLGRQASIHNRLIRFLRILEARKLPLEHADILNRLYWNTLIDVSAPEPGCPECLRALKQAGMILGVGTNMTLDWQLEKLRRLGLLSYFEFVVSSEEAGVEKPEAGLFALCARKAGVEPQECLFVGDSLKGDVLGAENAGMHALWYAPEQTDFAAHPGFSHYSQLQNRICMV